MLSKGEVRHQTNIKTFQQRSGKRKEANSIRKTKDAVKENNKNRRRVEGKFGMKRNSKNMVMLKMETIKRDLQETRKVSIKVEIKDKRNDDLL